MSRPVSPMSTVMERASAMMSTTLIMSAAPLMNALTKRLSESPPMMPMTSAMMRNHVEASSKYHCPRGSPVRNADQPSDTCSSVVTVPVTSPSNDKLAAHFVV